MSFIDPLFYLAEIPNLDLLIRRGKQYGLLPAAVGVSRSNLRGLPWRRPEKRDKLLKRFKELFLPL